MGGFEGIERSVMAIEYGPHRDAYQPIFWVRFKLLEYPLYFGHGSSD
jgi:hypothetical protein